MNLFAARVALRPRSLTEVLDLAAPFCLRNARLLGRLSALVLLPLGAAIGGLRLGLGWSWPAVWVTATALAWLAEGAFTVALGEALFRDPGEVRIGASVGRFLRRLPALITVQLIRLVVVGGCATLVLPVFLEGPRWLFPVEAILLENAPGGAIHPAQPVDGGAADRLLHGPGHGAAGAAAGGGGPRSICWAASCWRSCSSWASRSVHCSTTAVRHLPSWACCWRCRCRRRCDFWDTSTCVRAARAGTSSCASPPGRNESRARAIREARRLRDVQARLALAVGALALVSLVPAAAGAASSTHGSKDVAPLVDQVFKQRRHRFCHDPSYPLTQGGAGVVRPAAGQGHPLSVLAPGLRGRRPGRAGWAAAEAGSEAARAAAVRQRVVVGVAGLPGGAGDRDADPPGDGLVAPPRCRHGGGEAGPVRPGADAALAAAVETDVMRLLAASARGGGRRRLPAGHRGGLRRPAAQAGGLEPDPGGGHRTNGDYLRDLGQRQPALRPRVKQVVSEVERIEFGGDVPGESQFRWVHDRVLGLVTERLLVVLVALGPAGGGRWLPAPAGSVGRLPFGALGVAGSVAGKRHPGERAHLRPGAGA
jgi:hypothetical protein